MKASRICRRASALFFLITALISAQVADRPGVAASPLHTGALHIDITAGSIFGTVAGVQGSLPEFEQLPITGTGGPAGGIGLGASITPRLLFQTDIAFADGGHSTRNLGGGYTAEMYTRAFLLDAGVHVTLKTFRHRNQWIIPYWSAGVTTQQGRANLLVSFSSTGIEVPPGGLYVGASDLRITQASFAMHTGLGMRWWIRSGFGVRAEMRGYFPTGPINSPSARVLVGLLFSVR